MSRARPGEFRPVWSHPGTAQEPRRRPTEGPTEGQDSLTRPQEASRGAQTRLGAISKRFHSDLGAPRTSKNLKKCCTVSEFRVFRDFAREPSTEAQNAPKGPPREAQMSPRCAPGRPRSGPRAPQDGSKRRPERAKRRPRPPRSAPGEDPRGPKPPRCLQGALREPILASSWAPRGFIFEPSRRPCRASRTVYHTHESTVRNHWSKGLSRPLRSRCAEAIVH